MLIAWIGSPAEVDGTLPAVLVAACASQAARRLLLRDLAAAALGRAREGVVVAHAAGRPPLVARPAGSGLFLSSASRGGLAALAVAASPIGIDVEFEHPGAAVPWNVLHADEIALLRALSPGERAAAFARIWSLKEAYLKAAGTARAGCRTCTSGQHRDRDPPGTSR